MDETLAEGAWTLRAYTQYVRNLGEEYVFRRSIRVLTPAPALPLSSEGTSTAGEKIIPESKGAFDVTFFPEGGQALYSADIQLAFKAMNENGHSEHVTGVVYDDAGTECATFESEHLGMGSFRMYYHPERTYHAVCTNTNNISNRFDTPQAPSVV